MFCVRFVFAVEPQLHVVFVDGTDEAAEGEWKTFSGDPLPIFTFGEFEPNGGETQNCLGIHYLRATGLVDVACDEGTLILCEGPRKLQLIQMKLTRKLYVCQVLIFCRLSTSLQYMSLDIKRVGELLRHVT